MFKRPPSWDFARSRSGSASSFRFEVCLIHRQPTWVNPLSCTNTNKEKWEVGSVPKKGGKTPYQKEGASQKKGKAKPWEMSHNQNPVLQWRIRKAAATISGWDCPLPTFIYPGFEHVAHMQGSNPLRAPCCSGSRLRMDRLVENSQGPVHADH